MQTNEAIINSAIRRVALRDGLGGGYGAFKSAVSKQVRLEMGVLFWLRVALLVYQLVKTFWNSPEALEMRRNNG